MSIVVPEYRAFFDRKDGSLSGKFSIRAKDGEYLFEKLFARSGQVGFLHTSWANGESPIPYGQFTLNTRPNNLGQSAGATGIGEAFPIDNQGDRNTIADPTNKRRKRAGICLHEENAIPGTRGCIAIVYHEDWLRVRDWLRNLSDRLDSIPLEVL